MWGMLIVTGIGIIFLIIGYICANVWYIDWLGITAFVIGTLATCVGVVCAICFPLIAHGKVATYKENYNMVQMVIESGSETNNIAISQTIIEYNSWLSEAKASKKTFGIFSEYCLENLDELKYITLGE